MQLSCHGSTTATAKTVKHRGYSSEKFHWQTSSRFSKI